MMTAEEEQQVEELRANLERALARCTVAEQRAKALEGALRRAYEFSVNGRLRESQ